jgi:hypothetical protein
VSGTITTYPVEVTLDYDARLLEGMKRQRRHPHPPSRKTCPCCRWTSSTRIPKDSMSTSIGGGYTRVNITTGLSDGTNAEVTGGLVAGDVIWYQDAGGNAQLQAMLRAATPQRRKTGIRPSEETDHGRRQTDHHHA